MQRRPGAALVGFLLFALLLGGLTTFSPGWLALAIPLAVYLLAGYLLAPGKLELEVERSLSAERVAPGMPVTVTLRVSSRSRASQNGAAFVWAQQLVLEDPQPEIFSMVEGSARRVISLAPGETFTWSYTISSRRGFHTFPYVRASSSDPFGLFSQHAQLPTSGQLLVMPAWPHVRRIAIRTRATNVYSGTIPARQGGSGVDFYGVREYQPGDSIRSINWHVSARFPKAVYANEYEQERVADVGIILDARRKVNQFGPGLSIFDDSVAAAASLADAFLGAGNRVGLLIYGHFINWTLPGYGKGQREKILAALARAVPGDNQAFEGIYIPRMLFPVNSQVVFISPMIDEDVQPLIQLRAQGYGVIVVSPNSILNEAAHLLRQSSGHAREVDMAARILSVRRWITLQKLRHAAVQVVDWNVAHPFEQVVEGALSRPPSFMRAIGGGGR